MCSMSINVQLAHFRSFSFTPGPCSRHSNGPRAFDRCLPRWSDYMGVQPSFDLVCEINVTGTARLLELNLRHLIVGSGGSHPLTSQIQNLQRSHCGRVLGSDLFGEGAHVHFAPVPR